MERARRHKEEQGFEWTETAAEHRGNLAAASTGLHADAAVELQHAWKGSADEGPREDLMYRFCFSEVTLHQADQVQVDILAKKVAAEGEKTGSCPLCNRGWWGHEPSKNHLEKLREHALMDSLLGTPRGFRKLASGTPTRETSKHGLTQEDLSAFWGSELALLATRFWTSILDEHGSVSVKFGGPKSKTHVIPKEQIEGVSLVMVPYEGGQGKYDQTREATGGDLAVPFDRIAQSEDHDSIYPFPPTRKGWWPVVRLHSSKRLPETVQKVGTVNVTIIWVICIYQMMETPLVAWQLPTVEVSG
jgi:hypothetical protein